MPDRVRAAYAGIAYEVTTEDQGRKTVQELAARKVNLVKIWVDDRNGRAPRLAPNLFRAIIDEGHKHGLQVNAHVFYYTDASDLVNAGIDALVHLVRDKEMDDALVASVVQHNVYVQPNLAPEWTTYTGASALVEGRRSADDAAAGIDSAAGDRAHEEGVREPGSGCC